MAGLARAPRSSQPNSTVMLLMTLAQEGVLTQSSGGAAYREAFLKAIRAAITNKP